MSYLGILVGVVVAELIWHGFGPLVNFGSVALSRAVQRAERLNFTHHPTRMLWDCPGSAVFTIDMCGRKQRRISRRSCSDTSDLF